MYFFFLPIGDPFKERKKKILKIPDLTLHTEVRKKELFKGKLMRKILKVLIHSTLTMLFSWSLRAFHAQLGASQKPSASFFTRASRIVPLLYLLPQA